MYCHCFFSLLCKTWRGENTLNTHSERSRDQNRFRFNLKWSKKCQKMKFRKREIFPSTFDSFRLLLLHFLTRRIMWMVTLFYWNQTNFRLLVRHWVWLSHFRYVSDVICQHSLEMFGLLRHLSALTILKWAIFRIGWMVKEACNLQLVLQSHDKFMRYSLS